MIKFLLCFLLGHDWKCVGKEKSTRLDKRIELGLYINIVVICRQCQRCKKIKFTESNCEYEKLDIE